MQHSKRSGQKRQSLLSTSLRPRLFKVLLHLVQLPLVHLSLLDSGVFRRVRARLGYLHVAIELGDPPREGEAALVLAVEAGDDRRGRVAVLPTVVAVQRGVALA